ncbi:undecaprenyl-phosphate glucose phosphotransferase [Microbulbifer hydrolyticus]|uniref:Colanic acid biosynthesis UDP-glucose lipid carrier transferase n=1 Tax=Microbulbifer hydrolyticus TaxID=48074 RepID=A0A6P1TEX7_9GAMM|nr:undecaprenyl-phosphate glucose phosphotransferase [Microbulbifer hydrolyticus]MBB5211855.1 putative colanic acid biosynthesis UDP-glucose lipid carrier transferase [Microbulbifer hydrolyticus]QHQ40557.1 undecaprenyl-phosphate glucose phosphotransferase [Microbulbifer hydrolyticus]
MEQGWIRSRRGGITALYRLFDVLLIQGVLYASLAHFEVTPGKDWIIAGLLAAISFAFIAESVELYRSWRGETFKRILGTVAVAWVAVCIFLILLAFSFNAFAADYMRPAAAAWLVFTFFGLAFWRFCLRQFLFSIRLHGRNTRRAVIIGCTDSGYKLAKDLAANPQLGIHVDGFYEVPEFKDRISCIGDTSRFPILGSVDDAVEKGRSGKLDVVFIALPMRAEDVISETLDKFSDTTATVHILPNFFVAKMLHARWHQVGSSSLLSVFDTPIQGFDGWLKRLEDLVLATIILALISPVLLLVAAAVKFSSPGPVIFKQRRYGLDGQTIYVWKFRSMTAMDDGDKVEQAKEGDQRITSVGRVLRRTSLDELPQFFNVLQGTMSIVGPRPHAVAHNEEYRSRVNGYMLRHKVKPGITGLAQIKGFRGETDTLDKMSRRVEYDLEYIRRWSILLDLRIIFLTIYRGFYHKNAY